MGCGFAIASHLGPVDEKYRRPHHILQLVIQVTGLMARKNYVISKEKADFVIHPNLDRYGSFDFDNSDKMIELGYTTTKTQIAQLRRRWQKKSGTWARFVRTFTRRSTHGR
jgi:predicted acylesterase/phospholipase RssA